MMDIFLLINVVHAVENTNNSIKLYAAEKVPVLLKYDGIELGTNHMYYAENENKYPAYCINHQTLKDDYIATYYEAQIQGDITDINLWRIVINGYPYKKVNELGCNNEQEAQTATEHAVNCYYLKQDIEKYEGVDEAGNRTLQAMKNIISNAKKSNETDMVNKPVLNTKVYSKDFFEYIIAGKYKKEEKKEEEKIIEEDKNVIKETKTLPKTGR